MFRTSILPPELWGRILGMSRVLAAEERDEIRERLPFLKEEFGKVFSDREVQRVKKERGDFRAMALYNSNTRYISKLRTQIDYLEARLERLSKF